MTIWDAYCPKISMVHRAGIATGKPASGTTSSPCQRSASTTTIRVVDRRANGSGRRSTAPARRLSSFESVAGMCGQHSISSDQARMKGCSSIRRRSGTTTRSGSTSKSWRSTVLPTTPSPRRRARRTRITPCILSLVSTDSATCTCWICGAGARSPTSGWTR